MLHFTVAPLGLPITTLTFFYPEPLTNYTIVKIHISGSERRAVILEQVESPPFDVKSIDSVTSEHFTDYQIELARFIADYYVCSLGEALQLFHPFETNATAQPHKRDEHTPISLSESQEAARIFLGSHPVSLLFGDTGSGKTEIYMKLFQEKLSEGKRVLLLMPEISLTPQMHTRLKAHFGDNVVMWHSRLTKKQKEKALMRVRDGSAHVIAGARSALFLPITDLGLIVVDEEHDDSYKSSSRPRYHARDMAIYLGKLLNIPVVLGSATPALTSYVRYPHIRLKGGFHSSERHFRFERSFETLSPSILNAVAANQAASQQGMLFIPTRANFKYLICDTCGYTYQCPFCSVGMSLHVGARQLRCHYCNYRIAIPTACPECHSGHLVSNRMGTAEVVEQLSQHFADLRVGQFDRDTITTQRKLEQMLKQFNDHDLDLLVGTQMLSKGHDYHDVTLAVILGLDNILNLSDYRSRERALSLLVQIAGRSGRRHPSQVIVQTFNAPFFQHYLDRYETFLEDEKEFRRGLYPPYKRLCRVLFAHKNGTKAQEAMQTMQAAIEAVGIIKVVGAGPAPIEKIAGKFRFHMLLRADKSTDLIRVLRHTRVPLAEIDMDPVEFG